MIRSRFSKYVKAKVRMGIKYYVILRCFKTTFIHWTGNTDRPTERTGAVIIGVIIECVTKKALSLTTDQDSHWNRILLIAFAGTVS